MAKRPDSNGHGLAKVPSGISGLDEVTNGGLPKGRPTLICGGPGCGKSLMGIEFLVRGATQHGEPGVLMTFEETQEDIRKNVMSLGFDIDELIRRKKIIIDHVKVDRQEIDENGEYDLEGLFIRLGYAIDKIGAKRVLLDTIESLFSGLSNQAILRSEVRRLFYWLKERGITTVITGERGDGKLTRQGLEEYVSDCVILLDHRTINQISTRRLRVVKYRGSTHGTNEYPFLIDEQGISVLPVTSISLNHVASQQRVPTGIPRLDAMLGGKGFYRGSSVLITGTAGTGKSSVAAHFAAATCAGGERCLYFAFEESQNQIIRNMASIGLDLSRYVKKGLLQFVAARPSLHGLEMHLGVMHKHIQQFKPTAVVVDPISNFISAGEERDVHAMLIRLVDFLKTLQITVLFTNLTTGDMARETTDMGISSVMDTWLLLRDIEIGGERNRGIYVLKSRGMAHSNQIREFVISERGIDLLDVYVGPEGVLTGSARLAQEASEREEQSRREALTVRKQAELDQKKRALDAQILALEAQFAAEKDMMLRDMGVERTREKTLENLRDEMGRSRRADPYSTTGNGNSSERTKR
ncbi:MAG TPA: circadian clock protein KaiC [Tepidisphaeraceae bacterium]|nr:circadian clock protein KaiC [Tepidisphaeraceae bacterium]